LTCSVLERININLRLNEKLIIDTTNRFVFIHVPRTGGTSIREMLGVSKRCATGDVIFSTHATCNDFMTFAKAQGEEYFKFGFIRNPWERVYSIFCKHVKKSKVYTSKGFKYWLFDIHLRNDKHRKQPAFHYLKGVDYIARYEDFDNEWKYLLERIEMPIGKLPHINKCRDGKPYQDIYDDKMRQFVIKHHQADIVYGNYKF